MKIPFFIILSIFCTFTLNAEIKLHRLFSDGVILQRNQEVPIWGWGDKGAKVKVSFAGQTHEIEVDANDKWMVRLNPMKASSKSRNLTVTCEGKDLIIKNVLVGEVWICSGQSNMDFALGGICRKPRNAKYQPISDFINKQIKGLNDPLFRQFMVKREVSPLKEKENIIGTWYPATERFVKSFSAVGYCFGRELRRELNVPVGLIKCAWGGTRVEAWLPKAEYLKDPEQKKYYQKEINSLNAKISKWDGPKAAATNKANIEAHKQAVAKAKADGTKRPRYPRLIKGPDENNTIPSTLYNAMIAPLAPFAVKGCIWYQGEANTMFATDQYRKRFSSMIKGWREIWGQKRMDFYWCQLAQYKAVKDKPDNGKTWVDVCYQQSQCLEITNTGMAVLNDIGDARNIHPHNKVDVGKRLSLIALNKAYGKTKVVCSGPIYRGYKISDNKVIISFDSVGTGLIIGKKHLLDPVKEVSEDLKGFQICGADRIWKWAKAKIISKNAIEVYHPEIKKPVEVRYAWASNPESANLYNKPGLPASLFKTK